MYSTLENLRALVTERTLLQLCDDNNDGAFVVAPPNQAYANLVAAIEEADALINSHLSGRYTLPLSEPYPPLVIKLSAHLAVVNAYSRQRETDLPEGIKDRRKQCQDLLSQIRSEKIDIPELEKPGPAAYSVNKTDTDRLFTDELLSAL